MRMRTEKETQIAMLDATKDITEALHRHGAMSDEEFRESDARRREAGAKPLSLTMRRFDASAVTPTPVLDAAGIRALREREGASQAVLATHLGIAVGTLGQWERGLRKPDGPALRLLSLIQRHGLDYVR